MDGVNWVCSLLCLPLLFSTFSESCTNDTTEPLISGSRYRVEDWFFKANSVDRYYTPEQARVEGESWCSSDSLTASSEHPWLQVTFTKEFNISIIQTGGYDGFINYYMTSFQVHIGNGTEGSLRPLTRSDDSTQPLVFRRTGTYFTEDTVLPSPVITRVLRIVAVDWIPQNQVCLRLEALGCLPSPEPNTEASTYSTQETTHIEEISEESSGTMQKTILGFPRGRVILVGGVVGRSLCLLVFALLLIVIVVVAIVIFKRRSVVSCKGNMVGVTCTADIKQNTNCVDILTNNAATTSMNRQEDIEISCIAGTQEPSLYYEIPPNNPRGSTISTSGNKSYNTPSSMNRKKNMEQRFITGTKEPLDYKTCQTNPTASTIEMIRNECYNAPSSMKKQDGIKKRFEVEAKELSHEIPRYNTRSSSIQMIDNECYNAPYLMNKQDGIEKRFLAGIQEPSVEITRNNPRGRSIQIVSIECHNQPCSINWQDGMEPCIVAGSEECPLEYETQQKKTTARIIAMVRNECYNIPSSINRHDDIEKIFEGETQKLSPKIAQNTHRSSTIQTIGNESYNLPISTNRQDSMVPSIIAGNEEHPLDYETLQNTPTASIIEVARNEYYNAPSSINRHDGIEKIFVAETQALSPKIAQNSPKLSETPPEEAQTGMEPSVIAGTRDPPLDNKNH